ncbi:hypothetical protein M667_18335 [Cellulophaga baltica NN016038]|nr:hypothetical protein M667_18335 [Cellulophaga baltica NN016038]
MNTTIVNGVETLETVYSYIITPKALGTFSIGAAQITIKEKTYQTVPITITVSKAVNSTSIPTAPHENIYMLATVSEERIGVQDSLIVSHKVYVSPDVGIIDWKLATKLFVKGHGLHKLKIRLYTKLVSNLVDCCLFLRCFSSK